MSGLRFAHCNFIVEKSKGDNNARFSLVSNIENCE